MNVEQFENLSPYQIQEILIHDYNYSYSESAELAREIFAHLTDESAIFDIIFKK